jgi:hypothetical protein
VTRTPGEDGWTSFSDAERELPQRANLFRDVCHLLDRHQGSFVASDAGPVIGGGGILRHQDFGLAVFVDERFPVVGQVTDFVHGTFVDHQAWPSSGRPRLAQGIRLIDRRDQRSVAVVHVHGLRDSAGKTDTPARRQQAQRLVDVVHRLRRRGDLTVVCGDLNVLPGSETLTALHDIGLVDLVGASDTRTSHYPKPLRHASYMLVSDLNAVTRFQAPAAPEVSDHRPLILDL